ncbi:hypothetical protein [Romboutsia ilealis]|uniref:hypothetical protein n=1 Tax=Romboutsia ilealis TaxID=1115758 RepID=UPI00272C5273|nr:hypothetical protein [Romboutsia ilealis]
MKFSSHSTYINDNGEEVASATSILKILNKPFLSRWANSLGWKRQSVDKVLLASSEKGTMIHEAINAYLFGEKFKFEENDYCDKGTLMCALDNFISWKKDNDFKPIWGEKKMVCEKFGGTVDLYCEIDGKKTILDFKTGKSFYSSMFLQLAAYTYMLEGKDYEVEQVAILIVNENYCKIKVIKRKDLNDYIDTFLVLVELFYKVYDLNKEWKDLLDLK